MNLSALRLPLLALTLAACSQTEPPVPEFETVTIEYRDREPETQAAPLPWQKPADLASAPTASREAPAVVAAVPDSRGMVSPAPLGPDGRPVPEPQTVASSDYAPVTRYLKKWLPNFNKITECPNGITCRTAFTN